MSHKDFRDITRDLLVEGWKATPSGSTVKMSHPRGGFVMIPTSGKSQSVLQQVYTEIRRIKRSHGEDEQPQTNNVTQLHTGERPMNDQEKDSRLFKLEGENKILRETITDHQGRIARLEHELEEVTRLVLALPSQAKPVNVAQPSNDVESLIERTLSQKLASLMQGSSPVLAAEPVTKIDRMELIEREFGDLPPMQSKSAMMTSENEARLNANALYRYAEREGKKFRTQVDGCLLTGIRVK